MKTWFKRSFAFDSPAWLMPNLVQRLRGTPARMEEAVSDVSSHALTRRDGEHWSIQENAGHLLHLEPLWLGRVNDILNGAEALRDADLTNSGTEVANYNDAPLSQILSDFRTARHELVRRVEGQGEDVAEKSSTHPRLGQSMRLIDLIVFVAEHDDHHLARIHQMQRESGDDLTSRDAV